MAHNNNNNNNKNQELYINIEVPDSRKRFTIVYEKNEKENESLVLLVPNNLTFSAFLGQLINKFRLESNVRSKIRVKTNGRRIKSLNGTYNNQVLHFNISNLVDEDAEDDELGNSVERALTKSEEDNSFQNDLLNRKMKADKEYLQLFKSNNNNNNQFYNKIIKPLLKYQYENERKKTINTNDNNDNNNENNTNDNISKSNTKRILIIGESYPYRCKIIILDSNKDCRIVLYLIEDSTSSSSSSSTTTSTTTTTTTSELNYKYKVLLEENKDLSQLTIIQIEEILDQQYKENKQDILKTIDMIEKLYEKKVCKNLRISRSQEILDLFSELKTINTYSQNVLVSNIYEKVEKLSQHYDIPSSLSKNLLWQNHFEVKSITKNHCKEIDQEKNKQVIKSLSFPHKVKDIGLFRYKSIIEQTGNDSMVECPICYCDYNRDEMIELICGHRYCSGCLNQYFTTSVEDGNGLRVPISCPHLGCLNKCIDEVTVETNLLNYQMTSKLLKNMIKDFIFDVPDTHICPESGCGRLILGLKSSKLIGCVPYVTCDNHHFCLYCKKLGYHWPLNCSSHGDSSELFSYKWIMENTTICSRCKYPVEKNQGCNHMTCSRCRFEFCYLCGSKYSYIHNCDQGQKSKVKFFFDTLSNNYIDVNMDFMSEFFKKGDFSSHDPLISHLYRSFVTVITEKKIRSKKHLKLLESAIISLNALTSSSNKQIERVSTQQCRTILKRLLNSKENIINGLVLHKDQGPKIRSLSANICLNGSKKVLVSNVFVNSQFSDFKIEITNQLNKLLSSSSDNNNNNNNTNEPFDSKKIRIYNIYGGQIKSSIEILDGEPLFVTKSINEEWIEPQIPNLTPEEIEQAKKKIEQEKEKEVVIQIGKKYKTFTEIKLKDKRKQDKLKLLESQVNQLKIQEQLVNDINKDQNQPNHQENIDENNSKVLDQYSTYYKVTNQNDTEEKDEDDDENDGLESSDESEYDDINELLINEFINIESDSSSSDIEENEDLKQLQQIDKEQKQIEIVMKVLEYFQDDRNNGLDFDKVFEICKNAKNLSHGIRLVTKYLDETVYSKQYGVSQNHLLMKEILIDFYPNVSHNVVDNVLKETNYNLDKSKQLILHKFIKQQKRKQKKQLNNNNNENNNNNNNVNNNSTNFSTTAVTVANEYYQDDDYDEDYNNNDYYDDEEDQIYKNLHKGNVCLW